MGDNSAYTIMEATVMGAYNLGKLDKPLLEVLLAPYADTDIDSGGCCDLVSNDGLGVEEVIVKVWGEELPPRPDLPKRWEDWTDAQCAENDAWRDALYNASSEVKKACGW